MSEYSIAFVDNIEPLVASVFIDARAVTMPLGINGNVVQGYIDQQLSRINDNTIVYKIETINGNLVGYFTLQVDPINRTCYKASQILRQAFMQFETDITNFVSNFIISNDWTNDYLF